MDRRFISVVDLEATCWDSSESRGAQISEIIEIGLVMLDTETGEVVKPVSMKVKPERSTISPFCMALTGLTQNDVTHAPNLRQACEILRKNYDSHRYVWSSYGEWDRYMIEQSVGLAGTKSPFSGIHTNAQALFTWTLPPDKRDDFSLQKAVEVAGIPWIGRAHSAVDDAHNAANLLWLVLRRLRHN